MNFLVLYKSIYFTIVATTKKIFQQIILSKESFTILIVNLFKIGVGIFYICLQLFLYCHLFDNINLKVGILIQK